MVLASRSVASARRFAARPVGAASRTVRPVSEATYTIALVSVVLPVPGPPVSTVTLC